jgi:fructokinase
LRQTLIFYVITTKPINIKRYFMEHFKIGIDLGGTKTEAVLLNHEGRELHRRRIITPSKEGYATILESLHSIILDMIRCKSQGGEFTIGVGIPGSIDTETQLVQNANTTCLIGNPLQKDLEDLLGRPVRLENDANCFTLAESLWGAAQGYGLVFGIIMGTGCGGGICVKGNVRSGGHGIAGEWGHYSVDPQGARCYCGNRGCVESKISGSGVETAFFEKYNKRLNMHAIVQGYRKGDAQCRTAFQQFLDDFGRCLGGLISILDPDAVIIGGGLSNIDELYTHGVERVQAYAFHRHIKTPILKNILGDSAGVFGAAWIGI